MITLEIFRLLIYSARSNPSILMLMIQNWSFRCLLLIFHFLIQTSILVHGIVIHVETAHVPTNLLFWVIVSWLISSSFQLVVKTYYVLLLGCECSSLFCRICHYFINLISVYSRILILWKRSNRSILISNVQSVRISLFWIVISYTLRCPSILSRWHLSVVQNCS